MPSSDAASVDVIQIEDLELQVKLVKKYLTKNKSNTEEEKALLKSITKSKKLIKLTKQGQLSIFTRHSIFNEIEQSPVFQKLKSQETLSDDLSPKKSISYKESARKLLSSSGQLFFKLILLLGFYLSLKKQDGRTDRFKLTTTALSSLTPPAESAHQEQEASSPSPLTPQKDHFSDLKRKLTSETITLAPFSEQDIDAIASEPSSPQHLDNSLRPSESETIESSFIDIKGAPDYRRDPALKEAFKTTKSHEEPTERNNHDLQKELKTYLMKNKHPDGWVFELTQQTHDNIKIQHSDIENKRLPQHDIDVSASEVTARISLKAPPKDILYMANTMFYSYVITGGSVDELNLDSIKHPSMKLALERVKADYLANKKPVQSI